jgi:hypothetical protein
MGSEAFHHKGHQHIYYKEETQKWLALRSAFIGFITSHLLHQHIHSFKFSFVFHNSFQTFWESCRLCCFNSIQLLDFACAHLLPSFLPLRGRLGVT